MKTGPDLVQRCHRATVSSPADKNGTTVHMAKCNRRLFMATSSARQRFRVLLDQTPVHTYAATTSGLRRQLNSYIITGPGQYQRQVLQTAVAS